MNTICRLVHRLFSIKIVPSTPLALSLIIRPLCQTLSNTYMYIRLKIKPNSARIRFQSCQIFVLPYTGFELTPLIHCSTIRLALRPAPQTTRPHPLNIYDYQRYIQYDIFQLTGGRCNGQSGILTGICALRCFYLKTKYLNMCTEFVRTPLQRS